MAGRWFWGLGAALALVSLPGAGWAACPSGATRVEAGASIQAAVQGASAGAKFCIANGVHRGQSVVPKANQEFHFESPAAIMLGSKPLVGWTKEGTIWFAAGGGQDPPRTNIDECADGYPLCNEAIAVFLGAMPGTGAEEFKRAKPLKHVDAKSKVKPGTFFRDGSGRIYIGENPDGRQVEVTNTEKAFHGSAAGVLIKGGTVARYGPKLQQAAIFGAEATGWTIEGMRVFSNFSVGIDVGSGSTVRGSVIDGNGEMGLACGGSGIVFEGNRITNNGRWAGLHPDWEGGGFKCTEIKGEIVQRDGKPYGTGMHVAGNLIAYNGSVGAWFDEGTTKALPNGGIVVIGNDIRENDSVGLSFEISLGPILVTENVMVANGVTQGWLWGGCMQAYDSTGLEATKNHCDVSARHGNGMMVISQGGRNPDNVSGCGNNYHHNTIVLRGSGEDENNLTGATGDELQRFCGSNQNKYDSNTYYVATEADKGRPHWAWQADEYPWAEFRQRSNQEGKGTVVVGLPDVPPVMATVPPVEPPVIPPVEPPPVEPPPTCECRP